MSIEISSSLLRTTAILGVCATLLAGCAGDPGPRTVSGAAGGALVGGAIGALTGGGTGNIVAGAIAGGLVGGIIGNALDEEDRRRAYAAEMRPNMAGPGTPVAGIWRAGHARALGRQGRQSMA